MRKWVYLSMVLIACVIQLKAQSVSYTYKPFAEEGCTVSYTPVIVENEASIVVSVQSDRLVFSDNPTMMVRFFNTDQILQLEGKKLNTTSSNGGILIGNVLVPYTDMKAMAQFKITEDQIELFTKGVEKIRLSTFPIAHERVFKSDKIGMSLFQNYQVAKDKAKNF